MNAVIAAAYRISGDMYSAEDTAQDTFLEAFINLRNLRDRTAVRAWLAGIARRLALRAVSRRRETYDIADYRDTLTDFASVPETVVLAGETRREIAASFNRLSEKNRAVAELYFLSGLTTPEIARRLGIPLGTVTYRLSQARAKLKGDLTKLTDNTKNDGFITEVMEKVRKLKSYYADHFSYEGYGDALRETEKLVRGLPEGQDKLDAITLIESGRYYFIDQSEEQFIRAAEAAEKAGDGAALAGLHIERYITFVNRTRDYAAGRKMLTEDALPAVEKFGGSITGEVMFWIAQTHLAANDVTGAGEGFREVIRVSEEKSPYRANAIAALRAIECSHEHCEPLHKNAVTYGTILAESVYKKDGTLVFGHQPGFTLNSGNAVSIHPYIFYSASRFGNEKIFYDLSLKPGETRHGGAGETMTLVSANENVETPAGTFENCLYFVIDNLPDRANLSKYEAWYAPDTGLVKARVTGADYDETYELDEYEITGGDGFMPMHKGSRWSYVNRALPEYIYQRNDRVIEWTDGETANFSVVQLYAFRRGFRDSVELDSGLALQIAAGAAAEWGGLDSALDMLRRAVRINSNRQDVDIAIRAAGFISRTRGYYKRKYRFCPSRFHAGYISAQDGILRYSEQSILETGPYRFGTRFEENRIFGVKPLRFLQELTGGVWDDKWTDGYTEERQYERDGVLRITVRDGGAVTTGADTFPHTLKLTLTLERASDNKMYYMDDGYRYMHCGTKEYWFAPGVGIVRHDCTWGDILSSRCELVLYDIPAGGVAYMPVHIGSKWEYDEVNLTAEGYRAKRLMEITDGALDRYTLCESQEFVYIGTEDEYEAFKASLAARRPASPESV